MTEAILWRLGFSWRLAKKIRYFRVQGIAAGGAGADRIPRRAAPLLHGLHHGARPARPRQRAGGRRRAIAAGGRCRAPGTRVTDVQPDRGSGGRGARTAGDINGGDPTPARSRRARSAAACVVRSVSARLPS